MERDVIGGHEKDNPFCPASDGSGAGVHLGQWSGGLALPSRSGGRDAHQTSRKGGSRDGLPHFRRNLNAGADGPAD